jgi:hypothetical protein
MPSRRWSLWRPDLLLVLGLLGFALGKRLVLLPDWTQLDLDVYRRGAATLAAGRPVYEFVPGQEDGRHDQQCQPVTSGSSGPADA